MIMTPITIWMVSFYAAITPNYMPQTIDPKSEEVELIALKCREKKEKDLRGKKGKGEDDTKGTVPFIKSVRELDIVFPDKKKKPSVWEEGGNPLGVRATFISVPWHYICSKCAKVVHENHFVVYSFPDPREPEGQHESPLSGPDTDEGDDEETRLEVKWKYKLTGTAGGGAGGISYRGLVHQTINQVTTFAFYLYPCPPHECYDAPVQGGCEDTPNH